MQVGASFSVGDVLYKTFSTYFRNLPALLLIAIVIEAPLLLYGLVTGVPEDLDAFTVYTVVSSILGLLLWTFMTAAMMYLVVEDLAGRRPTIGACFRNGFGRAVPVLGVGILWYLCIVIGTALFIIPGIIVWCVLFVAVPASVIERPGVFGALSRSTELTRGNRWQILGLSLVLLLIVIAYSVVLALVLPDAFGEVGPTMSDSDWTVRVVLNLVTQVFLFAFGSVLAATTYVALRNDKDGVGVGELARVFE